MNNPPDTSREAAGNGENARPRMEAELRHARALQASGHEARLAARDVAAMRLLALKQEIAPLVEATPEMRGFVELALIAGETPRLWLDLVSYVVMSPDQQHWRLVQDTAEGHHIVFETDQLDEMAAFVRKFLAHRAIVRQRLLNTRELDAKPLARAVSGNAQSALMWMAWLAGLATGAFALLAALLATGRL